MFTNVLEKWADKEQLDLQYFKPHINKIMIEYEMLKNNESLF